MSNDSSYPKVKISGNTIINHEGYALWLSKDASDIEISNCVVLQDYCNFWVNPLLWLALKIIKRKYYSFPKNNCSPTTNTETSPEKGCCVNDNGEDEYVG